MIFNRKTLADKEIEIMMNEFNTELDRRIEAVRPKESLDDYLDRMIQKVS